MSGEGTVSQAAAPMHTMSQAAPSQRAPRTANTKANSEASQ